MDIRGSDGDALDGRRVALAISGSIAAIECPRLVRLLIRQGADVHVVMSRMATRLVTPTALEWCSGHPVVTRLTAQVEHIRLAGSGPERADVVLLAPATANSISKMALGIDDTPVTTLLSTALGSKLPIVVAPGMHEPMLDNPVVQRHLETLRSYDVHLVEPTVTENKAKMAPLETLVEAVIRAVTPPSLLGCRVLVTAGPTVEYLDPIRTLSNGSSGRMGVALAREAQRRGAHVTLVYGPAPTPPPPGVEVRAVRTTADMLHAVEDVVGACDIAMFAAAVADFAPRQTASAKLPTSQGGYTVELVPTPKIIDRARQLSPRTYMVGFKAETPASDEALIQAARSRLQQARLQLMAANRASNFGAAEGELHVVDAERSVALPAGSKARLARALWDEVIPRWRSWSGG